MSTHQICQNWILDQSELQPEEEKILNAHLAECTECSTLKRNVNQSVLLLQNAAQMKPAPGFTDRWKVMKAKREAEKQRIFRIRMIFGLGGALGLLSMAYCVLCFLPSNFSHTMLRISQFASSTAVTIGKMKLFVHAFRVPLIGIAVVFFALLTVYAFALFMSAVSARKDRVKKEGLIYEEE